MGIKKKLVQLKHQIFMNYENFVENFVNFRVIKSGVLLPNFTQFFFSKILLASRHHEIRLKTKLGATLTSEESVQFLPCSRRKKAHAL